MFKIGEFAKLNKVSIRMLRYYDEVGLLKPAATDPFTGYRFYEASQIPTLQKILLLRDMDFNVAEIAVVLDNWDSQTVIGRLIDKKKEILENIHLEQQCIKKIEMAIEDMRNQKIAVHYNIAVKAIPAYPIVSFRQSVANYFCEGTLWEKLYGFVETEHIALLSGVNNLAIYHNEGQADNGVDIEVGVLVKKLGQNKNGFVYRLTEPVATMACMMVYGRYENISPAYQGFAYWLAEHQQYEMAGPSRQICHIGAYNETNPENFLTEVQTPIQARA